MDTDALTEVLEEESELEPTLNGASSPDAPEGSILSALREKRSEIREDRRTKLSVPGYDDMLVAEYKAIPYELLQTIVKRSVKAKSSRADLNAMMDALIQACVSFHYRNEDGDLIPLNEVDPKFGDEPIVYDPRLAEVIGVTGDTARQICQAVFNNDLALADHNSDLIDWMRGSEDEESESF